jgi:hypothetical protein
VEFFLLIVFFSLLLMMTIQCRRYLSLNQHSSYGVSCARCALRFIHNTYTCISKLILLLIDPCPHLPHWGHWQIYHHRFYVRYITANDSNKYTCRFFFSLEYFISKRKYLIDLIFVRLKYAYIWTPHLWWCVKEA